MPRNINYNGTAQGYNSHGLSAHWEHMQGSRRSNDSKEWKDLKLGKPTRGHDLPPRVKPAVEIIKFKEVRDLEFQSELIHPGGIIQVLGT